MPHRSRSGEQTAHLLHSSAFASLLGQAPRPAELLGGVLTRLRRTS